MKSVSRKTYSSFGEGIPYPHLKSWMHERVEIPVESFEERDARYKRQHRALRLITAMVSRLLKRTGLMRIRWTLYRLVIGVFARGWMRFAHRLEEKGRKKVPKSGAILYMLHTSNNDVLNGITLFKEPISPFTAMGNGYFADIMEHFFGFITRRGTGQVLVEKIIRTLLLKNRYFIIWPEGRPEYEGKPIEAFSGIVRAYAVVNSQKDVIPFQPVILHGSENYWRHGHHHHHPHNGRHKRGKRRKRDNRPRKFVAHYYDPFFIPREWLKKPEDGGKTPREIIDYLMLKLARKFGFATLAKNRALEWRRAAKGKAWK
ncbi:MAG: hypothetical protein ACFFCS_25240 [Candidatus Hodarchaeota archaeon]